MSINPNSNFNNTKFKEFYSEITEEPKKHRQKLVKSIHKVSEKIQNLAPNTRLSFGPKGQIEPDNRYNITRGVAGYVPGIISGSEWSDDISNLQFWSENVLSQFSKFGVSNAKEVIQDLKEINKSMKELKNTYKQLNKPEQKKVVNQVIKKIEQTIGEIEYNAEKKYDKEGGIRHSYIQAKKEMYIENEQTETTFDNLKLTLGEGDFAKFIGSVTPESKYFKDLDSLLVPGVVKQFGASDLLTELILDVEDENFETKFSALKEDLQKIQKKGIPLSDQQNAQIKALKNSGLFPNIFGRIEMKERAEVEAGKHELQLQQNNTAFWGSVRQLLAGGAAVGASLLVPIPGAGLASGIGQKFAKQALDDLVGQWYGKKPEIDEKETLRNQLADLEKKLANEGTDAFYSAFTELCGKLEKSGKETNANLETKVKEAEAIVQELKNQLNRLK